MKAKNLGDDSRPAASSNSMALAASVHSANLNDGVLITASPLHKLFRLPKWQKDLKACWDKLAKGEYDWAHLAYTIWPSRVEKACEKDRSIAIAHGREDLCKVEPPKPKATRGKKAPVEPDEPDEDLEDQDE